MAKKMEPRVFLDDLVFPEGPRWHDGRLWFSDMHAHEVVAVDMQGSRETIAAVPNRPSGLGWLPDGRLLIVSMVDQKLLRLDRDGLSEVADLSALASFHCNDMVVDARGRAYIGNFGFDVLGGEAWRTTNLILVTPDGRVREVADELMFPNGTVITPDGETLIVAETPARHLTAFDIAEDGTLHNRRVWASFEALADGICLDDDGCIWIAAPIGGSFEDQKPSAFLRVAPGGEVLARIETTDGMDAYACMLGGPDGRTLFLCEATDPNPATIPGRGNGRIRAVEVAVPGAGWP